MKQQRRDTSLFDDLVNAVKGEEKLEQAQLKASMVGDRPAEEGFLQAESKKVLTQFVNPYKQLYLWAAQEALDLHAMSVMIESVRKIEEERLKKMKLINLTEDQVKVMSQQGSDNVKSLFEDDDEKTQESLKKLSKQDAFEVQKDVVMYVELREMLVQWQATFWLPKFKAEKARNYRSIMREYAKLEIENHTRTKKMWYNVMEHHKLDAKDMGPSQAI